MRALLALRREAALRHLTPPTLLPALLLRMDGVARALEPLAGRALAEHCHAMLHRAPGGGRRVVRVPWRGALRPVQPRHLLSRLGLGDAHS